MRVLVCHRPGGAFGYISDGWINALRDKNHVAQRWDGNVESWYAFNPDLYIGCSGHKQPIPTDRKCKIAIHVNPLGPINIEGIMESSDNIKWVLQQKPDAVFGYGFEADRVYWNGWKTKHNIIWVPMATGADRTLFRSVRDGAREFDIVYLGGRWAYKGKTIDKYLLPALRAVKSYKLHGWGDWPSGICSGPLPDDDTSTAMFLNTGRVAPCISEAHTLSYGIDIPERAFKVALCGALIIHDPVPRMNDIIPAAVVAKDPDEFVAMCVKYSQDERARLSLVQQQREQVLANHTYHHRISRLLLDLGFTNESMGMLL